MFNFLKFVLLLFLVPNLTHGQQFWLNFTITNAVQCSPIYLGFSRIVTQGDLPMSLTILPFNGEPVVIPVPNIAVNTSGLAVSFIPLQAGQKFIASLDDNAGKSIAQVSGVTTVMSSPTGNSSCLSSSSANSFHSNSKNNNDDDYELIGTPVQCQDIAVSYDTSQAPTVRAFVPNGDSAVLPQTSDNPTNGTATYTMTMQRGTQLLLMFDDGQQHRETTGLITVAGDSNSPQNCLNFSDSAAANTAPSATGNSPDDNTQGSTGIPQAVIIGCSAGGAVIVIIAIAMIVFVIRDRKLRRRKSEMNMFDFSDTRHIPSVPTTTPPRPPRSIKSLILAQGTSRGTFVELPDVESGGKSGSFITNPPYVMRELEGLDDGRAPMDSRSFSSWTNNDELSPTEVSMHRRPSTDPVQMLDIEGMLNMATALSGTQIMKQAMGNEEDDIPKSLRSRNSQATVRSLGVPRPTFTGRSQSYARHDREPSDVPADLTGSGTLSGISMLMPNPFSDEALELPSPFNRADEPARPTSDTIPPLSLERMEKGRKAPNQEELGKATSGEG
ncbi:hypothetical protein NP233_g2598 [Leucocoprinus birnbaumii]|uniref:Uncharacterized protein n=1 Tax=Leucocoprinus birnbaumii TaxID=56174 RepID=A0AAD5W0E6_9AGAR|nr:hypothetical protein NP233_g2598 [Leucocoprinus birnbaumii]